MANKLEFIIKLKDEFSGDLGKITSMLPSLGTVAAAAGAGIAAAGAAIWKMTSSAADAYDAVNDLSNRLGMTTEFISKMNYAAQMSGMSQDEMAVSLRKLSVTLGDASMGGEQSKKTFDALGISVRDASGNVRSAEEMMPELAAAFGDLDSAAQRAALAQELFGRSGITMLPVLTDGKQGLMDLWAEAEKFGLVMSTTAADNAAEFNDAMDRLKGSVTGVKNKLVEDLFPVFSKGFNSMANIIAENRETISKWASVAVEYIGKAAEFTAYAGGVIVDAFRAVHAIWETTKGSLAALTEYILNKLATLAGKAAGFMEAINFRGWLDTPIEKTRTFEKTVMDVADSVGSVANKSAQEVGEYFEGGFGKATKAVGTFIDKFKEGMNEAVPEGQKEGGGTEVVVEDPALKEKEKAYEQAYAQLLAMHDQYTLTQAEQLDSWYAKEQEKFRGHQDALMLLDETYQARKEEMRVAREESLNAQWEEAVLTGEEKIIAWYERQLELYDGLYGAKEQIDEIYGKKKEAWQKTQDKKTETDQKKAFDGMLSLGRAFGQKSFALVQAIAIPKMLIDAYEAAANAMKDFPFPVNVGIAAGQFAAVAGMIASVRGVSFGAAHGGLGYVPKEQTYLLDRGERVLSPRQNEDLAQFMAEGGTGGVTIEALNLHILENATDLDVLRGMDKADWQDLVYEKIVPALKELGRVGVTA